MEEEKITDRRVKRSQNLIKNAFYELSEEKEISKITVKDICDRADINRCTFYAHYGNIDVFLDALEQEYAQKFLDAFSLYHYDQNSSQMLDALFSCIKSNKELFALCFRDGSTGKGKSVISEAILKATLPNWLGQHTLSEEQAVLLEAFICCGGQKIMQLWYESDFSYDEAMVKDLLENAIKHGISYFLYKEN